MLAEDLRQVVDLDQRLATPVDLCNALEICGHRTRELLRALVEEAAADVAEAHLHELGLVRVADVLGERTAVSEDTAGQIRADRGQVARDRVQSAVILAHAAARDAAQQADGVRMPWIV